MYIPQEVVEHDLTIDYEYYIENNNNRLRWDLHKGRWCRLDPSHLGYWPERRAQSRCKMDMPPTTLCSWKVSISVKKPQRNIDLMSTIHVVPPPPTLYYHSTTLSQRSPSNLQLPCLGLQSLGLPALLVARQIGDISKPPAHINWLKLF